nr:MAG TPA: hypothetical protein [Caudoviricetes sp.]DAS23908.1 MAG TPA: hypothetical protein [Bacteriophage sp.]
MSLTRTHASTRGASTSHHHDHAPATTTKHQPRAPATKHARTQAPATAARAQQHSQHTNTP